MKKSLETLKSELWLRSSLRAATDERQGETNHKIAKGIEQIPIRQIYEQALYIEVSLLPKIQEKSGAESADYKRFAEMFRCLNWAIAVIDRYEFMQREVTRTKQLLEFFREHCETLEKELMKYTTVEDLLLSDGFDRYADAIKVRSENLRNQKL
jgi:hypothetical protein